ncbi:MAG: YtxH domain-containing protein [Bacteroidetes bacterium]|nr:YtxH domain-containing protein [Bacteroidota bacterium]MCY4204898.1 YtxH domain-containing protein [Bacteroidota bacterium]
MSKNRDLGQVPRALGWGLLLGGGVGFTMGLLLAPEEGSRLRRRVKFHLEELAKQVGNLAENIRSTGEGGDAKSEGEALVAQANEKAQKIHSDMDEVKYSAASTRSDSE